jgi:hypothetical protein
MKNRLFLFPAILSILLFIGSCGGIKPPLNEITNAKLAIEKAKALEAEKLSPLYFLMAKEKLQGAENAIKEGENEIALELAQKAKADAELAAVLSQKKTAEENALNAIEKAKGAEEKEKKVK